MNFMAILASGFISLTWILLGKIAWEGWRLVRSIPGASTTTHRTLSNMALGTTVLAVVFIELAVQLNGRIGVTPLLLIHWFFAFSFLTLFLLARFWLTGKKHRGVHLYLGPATILLFMAVTATGAPMLWRLLWR